MILVDWQTMFGKIVKDLGTRPIQNRMDLVDSVLILHEIRGLPLRCFVAHDTSYPRSRLQFREGLIQRRVLNLPDDSREQGRAGITPARVIAFDLSRSQ